MLVILSPSKDMADKVVGEEQTVYHTIPEHLGKSEKLVRQLQKRSTGQIAAQMKVNPKLAELNYIRFQQWNVDHTAQNSRCSILSYTGEAFRGLSAGGFSLDELNYSQSALRILSGLYGILRPLDLIQSYRLEMGLGIPFKEITNLYDFWSDAITKSLNQAIEESTGDKLLINLASKEYSSAINFKKLKFPIVTPSFKEEKSGQMKMVTIYTKRARGLMARFIIKNHIEKAEELKAFSEEGYYYENQLSKGNNWLFAR
jgi:cytoplasmic iron level regulating protein YaaA (DUF328/UPF0246 family)